MARSIDHAAALLPGQEMTKPSGPGVPWTRLLFIFLYVTASACAIVLLGLSWRNEANRRHAAEARAASSGTALRTAEQKAIALTAQNERVTARVKTLERSLRVVKGQSSRRADAIRELRDVVRTTETFVAALDGVDQTVSDTVTAEEALARPQARLGRQLKALDAYLRVTPEGSLDRRLLRTRLQALLRQLGALDTVIVRLTEGKTELDKTVKPLGKTKDLDRALQAALARAKLALRR